MSLRSYKTTQPEPSAQATENDAGLEQIRLHGELQSLSRPEGPTSPPCEASLQLLKLQRRLGPPGGLAQTRAPRL